MILHTDCILYYSFWRLQGVFLLGISLYCSIIGYLLLVDHHKLPFLQQQKATPSTNGKQHSTLTSMLPRGQFQKQ